MNRLVWKLLRRHLSVGQMVGFFLANLFGMCIVLGSLQFYKDVVPVFTQGDSFMKNTYLVVGKQVTALHTLRGKTPSFSSSEISELQSQPFVNSVGCFIPAQFDVYATLGGGRMGMSFSTDMFFESIPDAYIDTDLRNWTYEEGSDELPIILPRNYLNLYNFGFATTKGLPAISEGLISQIPIRFRLRGSQGERTMTGRVVAFSDRLNTILVPETFMKETNALLAPEVRPHSSRVILDVKNPADDRIAAFLAKNNYEAESGAADAGKMTYFLKLIVGIVLAVGLVICALSFYVLLLSIYLLLQKHTEKIDNLLLIGYSPWRVALPFHLLSLGLNSCVLLISLLAVHGLQSFYFPLLRRVYPELAPASCLPVLTLGAALFLFVSLLNYMAVRRKIMQVWHIHRH